MTPDERIAADELITELEYRMKRLLRNGDSCIKQSNSFKVDIEQPRQDGAEISWGSPSIIIEDTTNQSLITWKDGRLRVTLQGRRVLELTGAYVDMIDVDGLNKSLRLLRLRMVLDDLAEA